ncbi:MAG: hypothetical protein GY746_16210 [Gammaproteobacteria bacterium]|nr:hypothetical protein [Gammaproteobacteria bacterium]MCP4279736.1 hypothetical protein [Alteromonas sp.]
MAKLADILKQREQQYGSYAQKSLEIQVMKDVVRNSKNWNEMPAYMQESIDMIISKVGRVLNGDITHVDNFKDIAGYAQLVCTELEQPEPENEEAIKILKVDENSSPEDIEAALALILSVE